MQHQVLSLMVESFQRPRISALAPVPPASHTRSRGNHQPQIDRRAASCRAHSGEDRLGIPLHKPTAGRGGATSLDARASRRDRAPTTRPGSGRTCRCDGLPVEAKALQALMAWPKCGPGSASLGHPLVGILLNHTILTLLPARCQTALALNLLVGLEQLPIGNDARFDDLGQNPSAAGPLATSAASRSRHDYDGW